MPGYAVQWVEVEGPFYDDPVGGAGYRLLFDQLKLVPSKDPRTGVPLEIGPAPSAGPGGGRPGGPGGFGRAAIREAPYEVESAEPRKDAERLLRSFLKKAYRRPVAEADVKRFLALFDDQFNKGHGFTRSLLSAYSAVLASPGFVFVEEKPGRLDDHALATRLALFLWNSAPDDTLRALADKGELGKPAVLRAQTERLLNDPKVAAVRRGVHRLLARPAEDRRHVAVHHALQRLRARRPAQAGRGGGDAAVLRRAAAGRPACANFVASDFTFLNERLADHYGIKGVAGVRLPQGEAAGRQRPRRGDDAGQRPEGDGQRHDDLAGAARALDHRPHPRAETPPPPPSVEAVEPDIRGAMTIRQQLDKHRADAELRVLPPQDRPAGLRPGELRRDGRLARALPGGVRQGEAGQGPRHERAGVRSSTTPCRSTRPASCPTAGRSRTSRVEEAAGRGRGADRAEPGAAADGLRHRGAGAVLRPGRGREDPRRGEGQASTASAASSTRSCRANCSGTSRRGPAMNHATRPDVRGPVRLDAAADLPAAVPPRRGRRAGAAAPGVDAAAVRAGGRRRPVAAAAVLRSATTSACCPSRSSPRTPAATTRRRRT